MNIRHFGETDAASVQQRLISDLVGYQLQDIEWREFDWLFSFTTGLCLRVACPWRIVSEGRLAFAESDDGQQFGLPAPVDGPRESKRLLIGRKVEGIVIRADTADLTILFENGMRLEIWSNYGGYEPWELYDKSGFQVVAMGGGTLAIWDRNS